MSPASVRDTIILVPSVHTPHGHEPSPRSSERSAAWPLDVGKVRQIKMRWLLLSATISIPDDEMLKSLGQFISLRPEPELLVLKLG